MAGYSQNISLTDYGAEAADIDRRRKMAELLQQQALTPIEQQTAGGRVIPISWTQGLAKLLQGGVGAYKEAQAGKESKALTGRMRQEAQDWFSRMPQATTAESVGSSSDQAQFGMAPQTEQRQPSKQEMMSWALKGGLSGNPLAAQFASPFMAQAMKQDEPYTLAAGASRYGPGNTLVATAPVKPESFTLNPGDVRYDAKGNVIATAGVKPVVEHNFSVGDNLVQPHISFDGGVTWQPVPGSKPSAKFAKQVAPVVNQEAPVTPVTIADPKDPNKTIIVDGRTGKLIGAGPKATDIGKMENQRQFSMSGLGQTVEEAERILKGVGGNVPTGSAVGNLLDTAAGAFGITTSGAKEADRLKVLGGALVSKMPRMQGPQSDKDVLLYKQMAGQIGDPTIPRERRLSALEEVKRLYAKYENLQPQSPQQPNAGVSGGWSITPVQ